MSSLALIRATSNCMDKADKNSPTLDQFSRLQVAADLFNRELFGGQLRPVMISMVKKPNCYGVFAPDRYEGRDGGRLHMIGLDAMTAIQRPLPELLSTLVHEQCHQLVHDTGLPKGPGGHGDGWQKEMERVGLPPVAVGNSWRSATHRIDPDGEFMRVFKTNAEKLEELPWQEASRAAGATKKKQQRVKFTCSSCGLNVWSKPSAALFCGVCSHPNEDGSHTLVTLDCMEPVEGLEPPTAKPSRVPSMPVISEEVAAELLEHTGLDHPATDPTEARLALTKGLKTRQCALAKELDAPSRSDRLTALGRIWEIRSKQTADHPHAHKALRAAYMALREAIDTPGPAAA